MLREALPLLVTYASGPTVELGLRTVEVSTKPDYEIAQFVDELLSRHQLASALRLWPILADIERRPSRTVSLERDVSRGVIRGRLDVSRYLAMRSTAVSLPRNYPVVTAAYTPDTPENALVRQCLRSLAFSLRRTPFPVGSAESAAVGQQRARLVLYLKKSPWSAVRRVGELARLRSEVAARVRRRQTANDEAYSRLLEWVCEWQLDIAHLSSAAVANIVEAILAFPTSDAFWDRIFEVWCLEQVLASLRRIGMRAVDGPRPLFDRRRGPIAILEGTLGRASVHFQTHGPLGQARWTYRAGNSFTGIPDMVLRSDRETILLIDAKNRPVLVGASGTSEETYKMLGYAENFRAPNPSAFCAVLMFPADGHLHRILDGPLGGRMDLIATDLVTMRPSFETVLDLAIRAWLHAGQDEATSTRSEVSLCGTATA